MNTFKSMAKLILDIREEKEMSQEIFKNLFDSSKKSQYVSNMERGISSLPVKYHSIVAKATGRELEEFKRAYLEDAEINYNRRVEC